MLRCWAPASWARIAAQLTNLGVPVVLFDLAARKDDPYGIAGKALAGFAKLEPAPLATKEGGSPAPTVTRSASLSLGLCGGEVESGCLVDEQWLLDPERTRIDPLGGAIAPGHPLGATGAFRTATPAHGRRRRRQKYGIITMCGGTRMGAAGLVEAVD